METHAAATLFAGELCVSVKPYFDLFLIVETVRRLPFPVHGPVRMVLGGEPDTVTAVGQTHLFSVDFQNPLQVMNISDCSITALINKKTHGKDF